MPNNFSQSEQIALSSILGVMRQNPSIALFLMETFRPLHRLVHSYFLVMAPLISTVVNQNFVESLSELSGQPDAWNYLIEQLDS